MLAQGFDHLFPRVHPCSFFMLKYFLNARQGLSATKIILEWHVSAKCEHGLKPLCQYTKTL